MFLTLKLASVSNFGPPIAFLLFSTTIHSTSHRCILGLDASRSSSLACGSSLASTLARRLPQGSAPSAHATLTSIVGQTRLCRQYAISAPTSSRSAASQSDAPNSSGGARFDPASAASMGAPTPMDGSGGRWGWRMHRFGEAEGRVGGKRTGGERMCPSASYRGIEACVRIDPRSWLVAVGLRLAPGSLLLRKTVVICIFASRRCTSAPRWPKVAHASLALTWTRRLRANVTPPICAVVARIVLLRGTTTPALRPPLGAPRICRPLPHVFIANAAPPGSVFPIYSTSIIIAPLRAASHARVAAQPSHRNACRPREDERKARRASHEARCRPRVLRHEGCCGGTWAWAWPQLHPVRPMKKGETRCSVHIQPLVLIGGSVSLSRDDWYELRRDTRCGTTTTIPDVYNNTPLARPAPRACAAHHLASTSLRRLPFPLRVRRVHPHFQPPTAPTPRTPYLHTRLLSSTVSAAWGPAIRDGSPARVLCFESSIWMGPRWIGRCGAAPRACRPSPAAVGGGGETGWGEERWRRQRDTPVLPRRTRLVLGGKVWDGVGDPRSSRTRYHTPTPRMRQAQWTSAHENKSSGAPRTHTADIACSRRRFTATGENGGTQVKPPRASSPASPRQTSVLLTGDADGTTVTRADGLHFQKELSPAVRQDVDDAPPPRRRKRRNAALSGGGVDGRGMQDMPNKYQSAMRSTLALEEGYHLQDSGGH
ncbi:hypothetical protein B0H14DRAFT_3733664 [Mycena olivaceomarginata]|nr:hypothetical protein B0H14DRAFT_3733664 [Mycena olivaceomarginata]